MWPVLYCVMAEGVKREGGEERRLMVEAVRSLVGERKKGRGREGLRIDSIHYHVHPPLFFSSPHSLASCLYRCPGRGCVSVAATSPQGVGRGVL